MAQLKIRIISTMTVRTFTAQLSKKYNQDLGALSKAFLYSKKSVHALSVVGEGFYLIFRHRLYKNPNNPVNTRYVQYFCRRLGEVFNVKVQVHGVIPHHTALWVSNHISWLDIAVLGAGGRVFFLAKAEVESWPVIGHLAKWGGTLFIKRGSGDSARIREQITEFLKQGIPVLFFPEATTTDGKIVKKVHGRLLGAAIDAKTPVQACVIAYVNREGQLDSVIPYINDQSLIDNMTSVLKMDQVVAHLVALPSIDPEGHTVESLTQEVQKKMSEGLQALHHELGVSTL